MGCGPLEWGASRGAEGSVGGGDAEEEGEEVSNQLQQFIQINKWSRLWVTTH